jgi:hypothetical protein
VDEKPSADGRPPPSAANDTPAMRTRDTRAVPTGLTPGESREYPDVPGYEVAVRLGEVGPEADGRAERGGGLVEPAQGDEGDAQVVGGVGVIGLEVQRPPVAGCGVIEPAEAAAGVGAEEVVLRHRRAERHCLVEQVRACSFRPAWWARAPSRYRAVGWRGR